jgi:hypothetical protein
MTSVPRHWIVGAYTPSVDGEPVAGTDPDGIGTVAVGSGLEGRLYATLVDAQTAAKLLAAANPGGIYVVYEAEWWAQVNLTPVALYPVGLQAVIP